MSKKCTLVKMTSEHSKQVQASRIKRVKAITKKVIEDRDKRKREWQKWWR